VNERPTLLRQCAAEVLGTFVLVFFGTGAVHAAVLTGAQSGLWQVAVVWGVAISLAIYAVGAISGAHINPAITVAFAAYRRFPLRRVPPYVASQVAGAILAAATLYLLFGNILPRFEASEGLVRGRAGSELSAMMYGEYFPNPAIAKARAWSPDAVSHLQAMLAEGIGTALLALFVFALTDPANRARPRGGLFAIFIGLAVAVIISVLAPLTQAGLNPARDFGPRLFAWAAGWGSVAIPGPRGGFFTVYILAPILGAIAGAGVYQAVVRPALARSGADAARDKRNRKKGGSTVQPIQLILVGGFLGAGKTTLLAQAATRLAARGRRVGLITNDQAADLVDTSILEGRGFAVQEIAGGCFCCRFGNLVESAEEVIRRVDPHTIIGEPVGSCTDLSATVLQPLKKLHGDRFRVAPFTVLADPDRLAQVLGPPEESPLHESVIYILRKQLEEADLLVINKADRLTRARRRDLEEAARAAFPGRPVLAISALTGEGVDDWLDRLDTGRPAGRYVPEVDYDTYAEGEARLGWLNARARLHATRPVDWPRACEALLEAVRSRLAGESAEAAHIKLFLAGGGGSVVANLTSTADRPAARGKVPGDCREADLVINARADEAPEALRRIVEESVAAMARAGIEATIESVSSFRPARPTPVHRFDEPV